MMTRRTLLGLLGFTVLASSGGAARAAAPVYSVLTNNAVTVATPDRVLLINITKAGNRLIAVGEHGVIIYSDDNGQSWRQAVVPVRINLTSVAFATPQVGWAAGDYGVVLHTEDAGATWTKQITGVEVNQLMLANATQIANAAPNDDSAQRALRRANIFNEAGPDKPFLSIVATSTQNVTVFGAYRMAISSTDGGKTWADTSLTVGDPVSHNLYDANWIGTSLFIAGEAGSVLRSDDQGKSFSLLAAPSENTLFGILGAGGNAVVAYGVAGALFRSTDNGQSWTQINIPVQANITAGTVLRSGAVLAAVETGGIFVSSDQGVSFHQVHYNPGMGLFAVVQAANGDVVFAGTDGIRVVPLSSLN